ncbi:MAG: hypothetical protein HYZ26_09010 [Chloroflexi bacterium]|nr:hypothetical protein [Chloroflexota bacterium]
MTKRPIPLGHHFGLTLTLRPSAFAWAALLLLALIGLGAWWFKFPSGLAVVFGLLATAIHFASELWHQLGHAAAARKTGWPMSGLVFFTVLAVGRYPKDEPELPAEIHIRRALGGPIRSLTTAAALGALAYALRPIGGMAYALAEFAAWLNFIVFTLGALLPVRFLDGGTLLYWWPRRKKGNE